MGGIPQKNTWWSLQDEALLSDWKQQLERDAETLRAQSNVAGIRAVSII